MKMSLVLWKTPPLVSPIRYKKSKKICLTLIKSRKMCLKKITKIKIITFSSISETMISILKTSLAYKPKYFNQKRKNKVAKSREKERGVKDKQKSLISNKNKLKKKRSRNLSNLYLNLKKIF